MKKIIWIDDEPQFCRPFGDHLETSFATSVNYSSTIFNALEKLKVDNYDIIILDIYIPINKESLADEHVVEKDLLRFKYYPGLYLLTILKNKFTSHNFQNTKLILCSNIHSEFLYTEFRDVIPEQVNFLDKSKLDTTTIFDSILDKQKKKNGDQLNTEIDKDTLLKTCIDIMHDFKNYTSSFDKLLTKIHDFTQRNLNIALNEIYQKTIKNESEIYENNKFFTQLISESSDFINHVLTINSSPSIDQKKAIGDMKKAVEDLTKQIIGSKFFDYLKVAAIIKRINQSLDQIRKNKIKYNREAFKSITSALEYVHKTAILSDIETAKSLLNGTLLKYVEYYKQLQKESEIEEGMVQVEQTLVALIKDVKQIGNDYNVVINKLETNISDKVFIRGSMIGFKRAVEQIMLNGIKYSDRPPTINPWLNTRAEIKKENLLISIESWGPRISKEEIDERLLFKKGYSRNNSFSSESFGYGLHLTDDLLSTMNCELNVSSNKQVSGKYLNTFVITAPYVKL